MSKFKIENNEMQMKPKKVNLPWTVDCSVIEEPFNRIQIYFVSGMGHVGHLVHN
jgi:hypothetical protein